MAKEVAPKSVTCLVPFWFKDPGLDVPICYCSNLTRRDIVQAVKNGIKQFPKYKIIPGKILLENANLKTL